jgi:transposase
VEWPYERQTVGALLRQLDFYGCELAEVERRLAAEALDDPVVRRLMTIPGVDAMTAVTVLAAVGTSTAFDSADKLVSYLGLNPRVRQSGGTPRPSRPDHQGRLRQGPRDAGAGRVRRAALPGPAAGPAPADRCPARDADRGRP